MFGLLKAKNPYEQEAAGVYAPLLERACDPVFYKAYGVADTFEGRFDMLVLHVFLVMNRLLDKPGAERFNQSLFDVMFADMDQSLRETGKGDMGVPKHMRRMMVGFNGRVHAYRESVRDNKALEEALRRNIYNGAENAPAAQLLRYVRATEAHLEECSTDEIVAGHITLNPIEAE